MTEAATQVYPTWVKVQPGHYESEEQIDGTPDFIATHGRNGWSLKWRSSQQSVGGFHNIGEVKSYVASMVQGMANRTLSRRDRMGA